MKRLVDLAGEYESQYPPYSAKALLDKVHIMQCRNHEEAIESIVRYDNFIGSSIIFLGLSTEQSYSRNVSTTKCEVAGAGQVGLISYERIYIFLPFIYLTV